MERFVSCFFFTASRSTRGRMVMPWGGGQEGQTVSMWGGGDQPRARGWGRVGFEATSELSHPTAV